MISVDIGRLPAMKMMALNLPSERAKDRDTPASRAGVSKGSMTLRKIVQSGRWRDRAASS